MGRKKVRLYAAAKVMGLSLKAVRLAEEAGRLAVERPHERLVLVAEEDLLDFARSRGMQVGQGRATG